MESLTTAPPYSPIWNSPIWKVGTPQKTGDRRTIITIITSDGVACQQPLGSHQGAFRRSEQRWIALGMAEPQCSGKTFTRFVDATHLDQTLAQVLPGVVCVDGEIVFMNLHQCPAKEVLSLAMQTLVLPVGREAYQIDDLAAMIVVLL